VAELSTKVQENSRK